MMDYGINRTIANYISNNVSVAKSYNMSVGNLINNSKLAAKSFNMHLMPKCSCQIINQLGSSVGISLGHLWIKATDIENPYFKEVFSIATNSIPSPTIKGIAQILGKQISGIISNNCVNIERSETSDVCEFKPFLTPSSSFITEMQIKKVVTYLDECVISMLDKNKLCSFIVCRCLFWLKMCETYVQDDVHYNILSNMSEDDLLQSYVGWYKNSLKCHIPLAPKPKWCIPGYATILFKNKDTLIKDGNIRVRTVIEASREGKSHPFKKALQVVSKIGFLLMLTKQHKGMWLKKCLDIVPDVRRKMAKMKIAYGRHSLFYLFKYDIKEFFTNVIVSHVMPAIQFFLSDNKMVHDTIWIHKRNFKIIFLQPPKMKSLFYDITPFQIIEIIKFDMENAWFCLGESLIGKQKEGLSIGGFLSSMLAIMLANYAEHMAIMSSINRHKFFSNDTQIIDGVRATDDGLIFIVLDMRQTDIFPKALNILKVFKREFVKYMGGKIILEFDPVNNKYSYLENIVINTYNSILIMFFNKNYDQLFKEGTQAIIKGADMNSMTAEHIKVNSLTQAFMRIREGCSFDTFANICVFKFIYEVLKGYKWPRKWLKKSLFIVSNHISQSAEFWYALVRIIEEKIMKRGVKSELTDKLVLRKLEKIIYEEERHIRVIIDQNRNDVKRYFSYGVLSSLISSLGFRSKCWCACYLM